MAVKRPITAHDVANRAGVSQSAVSRAFTPGTRIADETRQRIITVAKELGYRPNLIARSLIKRRSRIIGVAVAYLQNQFNPEVLEALARALKQAGYNVLLFTADSSSTADPLIEDVLQFRVDALILGSASLSSAVAEEFAAAGIPVVLFNRTSAAASVSSVAGDNLKGGQTIAAFLAAGAHRRFGYLAGLENSSTNQEREAGFSSWLNENGFKPPRRAVGHYDFAEAMIAMRAICRRNPPDAVFCANDHMAIAAMEVARSELGLRVPEDISIVGFDDVGAARWPSYALTTYSQPVEPMVNETVRLLLDLIEEPSATPPRRHIIPGDLVVRRSARVPEHGLRISDGRTIWSPD